MSRFFCDCDLTPGPKHRIDFWAVGWVRPPPRGARRKPLCEFPCRPGVCEDAPRACDSCMVCCNVCSCLVFLSRLCEWIKEWAKRRNILLGPKLVVRLNFALGVSGAVPRAGSSLNSRCSGTRGMTSQKTGAAHGPRHPSCTINQDLSAASSESCLFFGNVTDLGVWAISWLGMEMIL